MKKIILVIALMFLALSMRGQVYVGGGLGITPGRDGYGIGVYIAPEAGYSVNKYLDVGGSISYRSNYNVFGFTPYLRCNFVTIADRVKFFLTFEAPMRFTKDYQNYNAFVRPGISVRVAKSVGLFANIGDFGYSYVISNGRSEGSWVALVDWNTVSIGVVFGF